MRTANPGQGSDSWGQNRQAQARGGGSRASSVGHAAGNPLGPCPHVRARDRKISASRKFTRQICGLNDFLTAEEILELLPTGGTSNFLVKEMARVGGSRRALGKQREVTYLK